MRAFHTTSRRNSTSSPKNSRRWNNEKRQARLIELRAAVGVIGEQLELRQLMSVENGFRILSSVNPCPCPPLMSVINPNIVPINANIIARSVQNIDLLGGQPIITANDLSSHGFDGTLGVTRIWDDAAASGNTVIGNHWTIVQDPFLEQNGTNGTIIAVDSSASQVWFDDDGSQNFTARLFSPDTLVHDTVNHWYTRTDSGGNVIRYYDFSTNTASVLRGKFIRLSDPDADLTIATYDVVTGHLTQMDRNNSHGGTNTIAAERYVYEYNVGTGRLADILQQNSIDGTTFSIVRKAVYSFYTNGASAGNDGDLQKVIIEDPSNNVIDTTVYRYYTNTTNGYTGGLEMIIGPDSVSRLTAAGFDPVTSTTTIVKTYADNYYEYDLTHRVTIAIVSMTGCSCTDDDGKGSYTYEYTANGTPGAGFNMWTDRTDETAPDGSTNITYLNLYDEVMLTIHTTVEGVSTATFYTYNGHGQVSMIALPSAVALPADLSSLNSTDLLNQTNGHYEYLNDTTGLIYNFDYYDSTTGSLTDGSSGTSNVSGGVINYFRDETLQHGQLGGAITPSSISNTGTTANVTTSAAHGYSVGDVIVISGADQQDYNGRFVIISSTSTTTFTYAMAHDPGGSATGTLYVLRPTLLDKQTYYSRTAGGATVRPVASHTVYRNADETGPETTSYTYDWYASIDRVKSQTTTLPAISTTQNGPGTNAADTFTDYSDQFGRTVFTKDGGGFINYSLYDDLTGGLRKTIVDADTSISADFTGGISPTNFAGLSATGGLRLTSNYVPDDFGRPKQITDPNANNTYLTYNDPAHESRAYTGWHVVGTSGTNSPYNTTGPVEIYVSAT